MNIIEACKDERLFRPYFGSEYRTFASWRWVMRAAYGLPINAKGKRFLHEVTGREQFNPAGYSQILALSGRQSGKSKGFAAVAGAYEAVLAGNERKINPGDPAMVAIISPTKTQSGIVHGYIKGIFNTSKVLRHQVVRETHEGFDLKNGIRIGVLAGNWKTVRGFKLLAAILDEAAFLGEETESHVNSDSELVSALLPALAATSGRLIAISSVHGKRGWCYDKWERHFGNDKSADFLCVHTPSKQMNPTLSDVIIKAAYENDYAKASAEFGSIWRDDVGLLISRELVEALVTKGLTQRLPREGTKSYAFVDVSGGRSDSSALAISHREDEKIVLDYIGEWRAPFDPQTVVKEMIAVLRQYKVTGVVGDAYGGEFVKTAFTSRGMVYRQSKLNKSQLYLELLPKLCSGEVKLLDNERMIKQLSSLERRSHSGSKDSVDHPKGQHDDLANVVAGVAQLTVSKRIKVGAF